ncbi:hypothetical protein NIES593_19600 [Hydrococcus rivularis NIES-593]|uniref:XisI protein n=1 Tax=Hydrococcus rivularis NIES-593 TaxID=1921803 RepID=A0A1U7H9J5_9CYAN|nr:hypothetical protein NIES593_19600 [Hydrococcus rivularis NIES-593]
MFVILKFIVDRNNSHYRLITMGWEGKRRVHSCFVHLEIIDDKIWIQRERINSFLKKTIIFNRNEFFD